MKFNHTSFTSAELATRFDSLGDRLAEVYRTRQTSIQFDLDSININTEGGTVASVGGFAVVALMVELEINVDDIKNLHVNRAEGEAIMGEHLGFGSTRGGYILAAWAAAHPEIWGSDFGGSVFDDNGWVAFNEKSADRVSVEVVSEWLKSVAVRLRALP